MQRKRPPQGTRSIHGPNKDARLKQEGKKIADDITCYQIVKDDPDFRTILETAEPDSEAYKRLVQEHGREIVAKAYRIGKKLRRNNM